jgi:hypothetical protein
VIYRDDGWISWPDWLGNGKERVAWKSFTEGRALARGLKLTGKTGWQAWSKSGQRPSDIPSRPDKVYRDDGWISWPDWLGSEGRRMNTKKEVLPFTEGRALARGLKLKGKTGWCEWSKSGQRPSDIPGCPDKTYRDDGWISWPDWLGNEGVEWESFTEARAVARGLGLTSERGWKALSKSGQRPSNIPSLPSSVYRDDGWVSWPDWLGYGSEGGAGGSGSSSSSSSTSTGGKFVFKTEKPSNPPPVQKPKPQR